MKKFPALLIILLLATLAITVVVSADQIVLSERDNNGDVERVIYDTDTREVTTTVNGNPVGTKPASKREIEAANRKDDLTRRELSQATLESLIEDMKNRPSANPDILRLENAVIALSES